MPHKSYGVLFSLLNHVKLFFLSLTMLNFKKIKLTKIVLYNSLKTHVAVVVENLYVSYVFLPLRRRDIVLANWILLPASAAAILA